MDNNLVYYFRIFRTNYLGPTLNWLNSTICIPVISGFFCGTTHLLILTILIKYFST